MSDSVFLDTNALIWGVEGDPRLGASSRNLADMALRDDLLFVSAVSFWEIAMLARRRRLTLAYPSHEWRQNVLRLGIVEVPLTGEIGIRAAELEGLHGDPADRIIAATATSQGATLLTADERLLSWQGPLRRHDARR
jgi:PIN domain nuclease of toxin-antitoxin system